MKKTINISRLLLVLFLAACTPSDIPAEPIVEFPAQTEEATQDEPAAEVPTTTLGVNLEAMREVPDLSSLPLGDDRSSDSPRVGYLWDCPRPDGGGGPMTAGDWLDEVSGTYNLEIRPSVDGAVTWESQVTIRVEGDVRIIEANGLPDHPTGVFPVSASDDAYQFDRNPNTIAEQSYHLELPANPQLTTPTCASGEVGIAISGVVINNAFDALLRDAVAHEIQDDCFGHPQEGGFYHYHGYSPCLEEQNTTGPSPLIGYALDGFGIYGPFDENGQLLSSADLDECHGRTSLVLWDGEWVEMYHYVATWDFPYTVGCFRGTPVRFGDAISGGADGDDQQQDAGAAGGGPPLEAINACSGLAEGNACSFQVPNGSVNGTCRDIQQTLACVP